MTRIAELESNLAELTNEIKRLEREYAVLKKQMVENQLWELRCKETATRIRKEIEYEKSPYRFTLFRKLI